MNQHAKNHSTLYIIERKVRRLRLLNRSRGKTKPISINSLAFLGKTPSGPMKRYRAAPGLTSNANGTRHG